MSSASSAVSRYGSAGAATTTSAQSSTSNSSSLKPKPSTSRLKPRGFLPSSTLSPPPRSNFARAKTEPTASLPTTGPSGSSSLPQRKPSTLSKAPSSIPKPTMTSTIPTVMPTTQSKLKTSPPSRQYAAFSIGSSASRPSPSLGSTVSSDKSEKKPRNVIRRKNSSSNSQFTFGLGSLRSGSTTSANGSTTSITSTSSYAGMGSKSGASAMVLGIPLPTNMSSSSFHHYSNSSASSSVPRISTRDLPPPVNINAAHSSGSSIHRNESPSNFSMASSPSSISSHSPGLPPPGFRQRTQSPNRPPVTRNRSGSIGQILNDLGDSKAKCDAEKGLDSVRESTTSTSSSSTVRGGAQESEGGRQKAVPSTPPPPPLPSYLNTSRMASPPVPAKNQSPMLPFGTCRSKNSNAVPTRPSREGTPDLHTSGLGLSIPVIQSNLTTGPHVKTRSRSIGTIGLGIGIKPTAQRKGSAPSSTPPPPSPSYPPSASGSRRPSVTNTGAGTHNVPNLGVTSPTIGFAYNSLPTAIPTRKRGDSIESGPRERSPTRASPGRPPRPGLFSRGRSKTSDQIELRKGPAAGTGHEGYGNYSRQTRGRSGSNTSTSGSWGRSGSQSSITSDSNFGSGGGSRSGRRSGSREGRVDMDDYFMDKLKPVVLAGGGEVVENQNLSSPEYRPRNGSISEQGGFTMSRSGSENMSSDSKAPGSREGQGYPQVTSGKVFGARRAATPIPAPIKISGQPFSHARTPPIIQDPKRPREVKQAVSDAHRKLEKAFTPVLGQEAWAGDLYSQISPPLATDPLPTVPTKTKRWNFLQRSQNSSKNSPAATVPITGRRQPRPAHYAIMDSLEQQEAAHVKDLMLELRNKCKEPHEQLESNRSYTTAVRKQQHVDSILLPEPPLPLQPSASPRPPSPPTKSPSPGVNVTPALSPLPLVQSPPLPRKNTPEAEFIEANKHEIRQAKANERKRLQQAGGRLPILGFGKKSDSSRQAGTLVSSQPGPSSHRSRPSESEIQQSTKSGQKPIPGKLPSLQIHFPKQVRFGSPEGWSAPAHIAAGHVENSLAQQIAAKNFALQPVTAREPQQQIDWSGYALGNVNANTTTLGLPANEVCDSLDAADANVKSCDWPIRKDSIPSVAGDHFLTIPFVPADILTPRAAKEFERAELPFAPEEETDDVWSEYDDLLEDNDYFGRPFSLELELEDAISSPRRSGFKSNTSSLGSPFQFDNYSSVYKAFMEDESVTINNAYCRESPTLPNHDDLRPSESSANSDKTNSTIFELDESPILEMAQFATATSAPPKIKVIPLREGQHKNQPPPTPFSLTKFLQYYTGAGIQENDDSGVLNAIDAVHHSNGSTKSRVSNGSNSSNGSTGSSAFSEVGLDDEMKLRLWALMASTWLNFDRVLVSPAHEEFGGVSVKGKEKATHKLRERVEGRILVVDGLGTDEWSYYCALTYPSCTVYNLSPSLNSSEVGAGNDSPTGLSKPPNHKQIHHTSFDTVFPFPVGFFSVVSLRFLPSSSYPSLPFILQQCQRVLAAGGYIEVTVLDADLVNMGNRTKRAVDLNRGIMVREFEETAANATPGTVSCLSASTIAAKAASERTLRLLEKGFEDVNRCLVALPVVGHIDGSISLGSVQGSIDQTHNPVIIKPAELAGDEQGSLRKPIDAHNSNITDVVSKVGRYWYTRTYERVMTGERGESMGRSMWNDKGLLRECSKKKTGMRMLVAYARKPLAVQVEGKSTPKLAVSQGGERKEDMNSNITIPITPGVFPKPLSVKKTGQKSVAFRE
ncbi:hypothetical protein L211DRAFT_565124 [Terfezia boudieri ATCC MYA-4762]|uniref:Methyltransferase type 11 domain-containing protein n=1 Tax=Terfezia boudieri ATCC MYA-4762 TaxID=1051890 RepID=A0A3N4LXU1_9PEZI|nr:hypothetical protein L211DRAFT_565124 [Terfezia boudieri ATCC MYA-4762]